MKVLIVEDVSLKYGKIHNVMTKHGLRNEDIQHAMTAADAVKLLEATSFDLMVLDINIPRRLGENTTRGGGLNILSALGRTTTLIRPRYIIGLTAYADVASEFGPKFAEELWSLVLYH